MTATNKRTRTPAAAAPAAKPAAPAAAPAKPPTPPPAPAAQDDELDDLLEDGEEGAPPPADGAAPPADEPPFEEEKQPLSRKEYEKKKLEEEKGKKAAKVKPKIVPTDDVMRDKKGNVKKDADGDEMRYAPGFHKGVGFVTEAGVLFPVHYPFQGGFVGTFGNVILNRCPSCGYRQSIDEARSGVCGKCRYSQLEQLEQVEL